MQKYFIDSSTPNDFDKVVRFLNARQIPISDRDKAKLVVSAELTPEQRDALLDLPLEETLSIGTTPLG